MKLHRYVDHQRLHIVTKGVISLSISVLLLFRHYISHKITFGAPSSGGVLRSACGAFINKQKAVDVPKEHLSESLEINLLGSVNLMQVIGKRMGASGRGGSIVNISSHLGTLALGGMLAYSLPKAGLDMATKMFAIELGPDKVRVNTVLPGAVSTDLLRRVQTEETIQHLVSRVPLGRLSEVQDVADIVLFLLSQRSAMINGSTMMVDGGVGCRLP